MLFFIVVGLIGASIGFYFMAKDAYEDNKSSDYSYYQRSVIGSGLGGAALGAIFGVLAGLVIIFLVAWLGPEVTVSNRLQNLQDGSNVSGSFFLGIGSIDQEMQYAYYQQTSDGGYELVTHPAEEAKVYYDDQNPRVEQQCFDENAFWGLFRGLGMCDHHVKFYVPVGSIKNNYVLDAKG